MGKFDGILICTDLDGTLYRSDKSISLENQEAIEYFKQEGGYFTFVTGRMPHYSMQAYHAVKPNVPFGCINGGGLYDGATGRYVWTQAMGEGICELIECIDRQFPSVGIQVSCFEKSYFAKENIVWEYFRRITGVPNLVCDYRNVREPIAKIVFGSAVEDELLAIEQTLRSHPLSEEFVFVRSERSLFEILPKGINKGIALAKLAEYLHVDPTRTIGIGDYNNDVPMFGAAAVGVAVSNACPAALAAADVVTVSNEEHAIARVINDSIRLLDENAKRSEQNR